MSVIAENGQPMRFSRIIEQVEGVRQKSLTKMLRGLEHDVEMLDNVIPLLALGREKTSTGFSMPTRIPMGARYKSYSVTPTSGSYLAKNGFALAPAHDVPAPALFFSLHSRNDQRPVSA